MEGGGFPPIRWGRTHCEHKCGSILDLGMTKPGIGKIKAVQAHRLDVAVQPLAIDVLRNDVQLLSIPELRRSIWNAWRTDEIDILPGDREDTQR